MAKQGKLIIISAPSGAGKTTIVNKLLERNSSFITSISYTTRSPRPGEENGIHYHFISSDDFESKKENGFFLEYAEVFGKWYGTSKDFVMDTVQQNRNVILTLDVQGMKKIVKKVKGEIPLVSIFIMPPSIAALKRRLTKRKTETKAQIDQRLKIAEKEIKERDSYDYVVINKKIDQAVKAVEKIIKQK